MPTRKYSSSTPIVRGLKTYGHEHVDDETIREQLDASAGTKNEKQPIQKGEGHHPSRKIPEMILIDVDFSLTTRE